MFNSSQIFKFQHSQAYDRAHIETPKAKGPTRRRQAGGTEDGGWTGASAERLADELAVRNIEVVEAAIFEDGIAMVVSDGPIHGIFVDWAFESKSH